MNPSMPTILIMAGGTGGHIFPGLALAEQLKRMGLAVHWLGAQGGMESRKVPEHGIELSMIKIRGVRNTGWKGWLTLPFRLLCAIREAMGHLRNIKPACAVSFGGYAAGPGGIAAWLKGIPLVVHEQNRVPGMTNRLLARLANTVFEAFDGSFQASSRAIAVGNPVRSAFLDIPGPAQRFETRCDMLPRLLVTGGSQGAEALNRMVPEALALLPKALHVQVRHQSGRDRVEQTRARYSVAENDLRVEEFIEDMSEAFSWADLLVCRAGALTVSEIAATGIASILIPFPHAVDDHQTHNAEVLVNAGGAIILQEAELTPESLAHELGSLLADRPSLARMADCARSVRRTDAAVQLAQACSQFALKGGDVS
jgi:UDP-N-acetylglucosamine--N-acetylmuramyl-(pentapeptide) pyrophosphoryl-undecaprenol N-acetylglucosamine transferase